MVSFGSVRVVLTLHVHRVEELWGYGFLFLNFKECSRQYQDLGWALQFLTKAVHNGARRVWLLSSVEWPVCIASRREPQA